MPAIRLNEGRFLLGLGRDTWRVKWTEVYQYIVLHWKTSHCIMINLESIAVAMYPDLKKDTQARTQFCQSYMWRVIEERQKASELRRQKKREAEEEDSTSVRWI